VVFSFSSVLPERLAVSHPVSIISLTKAINAK